MCSALCRIKLLNDTARHVMEPASYSDYLGGFTVAITPAAFAARFCPFLIQQVASSTPLIANGLQPGDINYYIGPSEADIGQYERPLGSLVRMQFLPSIPFDEEHANALGREQTYLQGIVDSELVLASKMPRADRPPLTSTPLKTVHEAIKSRQKMMDEHCIKGTEDVGVADLILAEATVLADSNDPIHMRSAANRLNKAASWYSTGNLNRSAALTAEISAFLYTVLANAVEEPHSSIHPDEMRLRTIESHFHSAQCWLNSVEYNLDLVECGLGTFRGIRNWLMGKRLYEKYKSRPLGVALRNAPHELNPRLSDDALLGHWFVEHMNLDRTVLYELLRIAAEWHNQSDLYEDATNNRMFMLFHQMQRLDYISYHESYDWNAAAHALEMAASAWEYVGKPHDVIAETKSLASLARAIGEKG